MKLPQAPGKRLVQDPNPHWSGPQRCVQEEGVPTSSEEAGTWAWRAPLWNAAPGMRSGPEQRPLEPEAS